MRIFVTGASGFVGSAIVQELVSAGHQVLGLVRSDAGAQSVIAAGAQVHRGHLDDLESLRSGAAQSDAVVHTAFNHDFSKFQANCEMDQRAIQALGSALEGSGRPLIVTSGTALLAPGRVSTEQDVREPGASAFPRVSEEAAAATTALGVRASVVRLPPTVHGDGDHGFVPRLIAIAREQGASAYIGEGLNRWPAVHRLDAARLYRLILENGSASPRYHAIAEEGVPFREIAGVIARRLGVPLVSKTPEDAPAHFGWFAQFAAIDCPASSQWTRDTLGWAPRETELISDLDHPRYFEV